VEELTVSILLHGSCWIVSTGIIHQLPPVIVSQLEQFLVSRMCDTGQSHSRESSVSVASSDSNNSTGLVLSVSALTKRGPGSGSGSSGCKDSPRSEVEDDSGVVDSISVSSSDVTMGQTQVQGHHSEANMENMVRLEPEGINEEDSQNFTSFLSVDKRLYGRLQEELTQAQSELKLKEEQVVKLSRIRDDVEREMEDLTASLFQEAHKMVQEANIKRAQAEKALAESEMKVDGLETEVSALKALVITSTPSMSSKHQPQSHHRATAETSGDASQSSSSPCKPRLSQDSVDSVYSGDSDRHIDPVLRQEYLAWKKDPSMNETQPFLSRIYQEDVNPCLQFSNSDLSSRVRTAIHDNTLCLVPIKPDTMENPRNCALLDQPRTVRYKLKLDGEEKEEFFICQLARNRLATVCDFLTYCRYVTQGMVKSPVNDVYWEIMDLRRKMTCARLGF